jgi:hypothetical protein
LDLDHVVQDFKTQLLSQVVGFYQEQHGRDPTEEETLEAMKDVLRAMAGGQTEEVEEEEGAEEENEEETEKENVEEDSKKPVATPSKVTRKRPAEEIPTEEQPVKKKIKLPEAQKAEN